MPYYADSTNRKVFRELHLHTPQDVSEVICSICHQRCGSQDVLVQISGHPQCQCVFGRGCIWQWLQSGNAASNTCPSCHAIFYNPQGEDVTSQPDSDRDDDIDANSDSYPPGACGNSQGPRIRQDRTRRGEAPSPSPTHSSFASANNTAASRQPHLGRQRFEQAHLSQEDRPDSHRQHALSPLTPTISSRSYSINSSSTGSTSTRASSNSSDANTTAIENFVDDLWAGTWDLVFESWRLTAPNRPKSRSITRAQLVALVLDVYPFEDDISKDTNAMLLERLVIRARKMVNKHSKNGFFHEDAGLRTEREDLMLAVGFEV